MRCRVVDDSTAMRRLVRNVLRQIHIEDALEATTGEAALAVCALGMDLIITDWHLPGMSGGEPIRRLRAATETATIPILMMTTDGVTDHLIGAVRAGVNGYIEKPFTPEALREKIDRALSHAGVAPRSRTPPC